MVPGGSADALIGVARWGRGPNPDGGPAARRRDEGYLNDIARSGNAADGPDPASRTDRDFRLAPLVTSAPFR